MAREHAGVLPDGATVSLGVTTRRFDEFLKDTSDLDSDPVRDRIRDEFGGVQQKIAYLHQVHSGKVVTLFPAGRLSALPSGDFQMSEADGMITAESGVRLVVLTADCLPIYAVVPSDPSFVAILHAGWRGSEAQISRELIGQLKALSGLDPRFYTIHFGPAIRSCCYEVGHDFVGRFPRSSFGEEKSGKFHFDLVGENRRQLIEEGIEPEKINDWGLCTACRGDTFYSNRRDPKKAGRMLSWIVKTNVILSAAKDLTTKKKDFLGDSSLRSE